MIIMEGNEENMVLAGIGATQVGWGGCRWTKLSINAILLNST